VDPVNRAEVLHWSPADYLAEHKTMRLTAEGHGCYMLLLWHMWLSTDEQCIFPIDFTVLGGIWKMCPEQASEMYDELMLPGAPLFTIVKRKKMPYLFSKRLHAQAVAAQKFLAIQSAKGVASGAARRAKFSGAQREQGKQGEPVLNPGSTESEPEANRNEPSYPRTLVSASSRNPVDQTPVSSGSTARKRTERGSHPQDDPTTTVECWIGKLGRDLTPNELASVKRWARDYGRIETQVQIGYAAQGGYVDNPKRIGGALKASKGAAS
jgi:hypothetical protein